MKKITFCWCLLLVIIFLACQFPDNSFARTALCVPATARHRVIAVPAGLADARHFNSNKVTSFWFKQPLQHQLKRLQLFKEHCNSITSSRMFMVGNTGIHFLTIFIR